MTEVNAQVAPKVTILRGQSGPALRNSRIRRDWYGSSGHGDRPLLCRGAKSTRDDKKRPHPGKKFAQDRRLSRTSTGGHLQRDPRAKSARLLNLDPLFLQIANNARVKRDG